MKKWALLYFMLLSGFGFAQDWSGQYLGATHFYLVNNSNTITIIRQDSSSVNGVGETIFYPSLLFRNVLNENIIDSNCTFWGMQECIAKKDAPTLIGSKIITGGTSVRYFNFFGDSVNIKFNVPINDTQVVFNNINHFIKLKCIYKDSSTIFNSTDSIIKFQIIHYDSLGSLTSSQMQGDTIIFTKNTGLFEGYAFHYFPDSLVKINLEGIRNPNYGFSGLTMADIYDLQVGDKYETYRYGPTPFLRNMYEITSRTDNANDVSYTMNNFEGSSGTQYPPVNYTYTSSSISVSYSKINYVDEGFFDDASLAYIKNYSLFNNCWIGTIFSSSWNDYGTYGYCPSANCYGSADLYGSWSYDKTYGQSLGKIYDHGTQNIFNQPQYFYSLIYFDIQGQECGSSFILSDDEIENIFQISIFPNPANKNITIQSDKNLVNGKISITDLSGRKILNQNLNNLNSNQISISNLSNGIYLMQIYSEDKIIRTEKLVIKG